MPMAMLELLLADLGQLSSAVTFISGFHVTQTMEGERMKRECESKRRVHQIKAGSVATFGA